jgi:hypothetical protein
MHAGGCKPGKCPVRMDSIGLTHHYAQQCEHELKLQKLTTANVAPATTAATLSASSAPAPSMDLVNFNMLLSKLSKLKGLDDFDSWAYMSKQFVDNAGLLGDLTRTAIKLNMTSVTALTPWTHKVGAMKLAIIRVVEL